jgi:hypothetical protein
MSEISRDIILDLLPVYLAGEASTDTRKLVDEFAVTDPQIARLVRAGSGDSLPTDFALNLPPGAETKAFLKTRKRLRRQGWIMAAAIFFTAMSISFQWNSETGFHFTYQEAPQIAVLLSIISLIFWIAYFRYRRRFGSQAIMNS